MKRTVGFTASLFALMLIAFAIPASAAEIYTATVGLSPAAEINPPVTPPANATGGMLVTITVTRDAGGNVTAATMSFLGTVSIPGAANITGLHIHEGDISSNGSVRFDSGISAGTPLPLTNGTALINANVASVDLMALGKLLAKPAGFYVNVHTNVNTAGAIRGQLVRLTETLSNTVAMTTAQEKDPSAPLPANASGTGTITIKPVRNPTTGQIISGTVTFTVQYDLPAGSVINGLHIHKGVAGDNGSVVINTGLSGANTVTTATGKGTLNFEVQITAANANGLIALRELVTNPPGFYVNLHTSANSSGVIRGQLTSVAAPVAIQQSSAYFLETGATDAQIALLISGSDLTSVLTSSVLVNGQQVAAQLDLSTGAFNVVIPAALRANAGTLFVQARGASGLLSAPVAIVVAPAASVNAAAFATADAAKYGLNQATPEAIVAGFGTKLASQTVVATTQPLPVSLDGTSVYVNGVAARLFFVSPSQINYLVPVGTLLGTAAIVVVAKDGTVSQGQLNVSQSSPGIFTSNSAGNGAPAAVASTDGANFTILMGNPDGTPREISAGNFVSLFGTGFRFASTAMAMKIGSTDVTPLGFAAQGQFDGLDQVNVQVPASMAGAGEVNLTFTIDGKTSNAVRLKIK
ncbi:MAG: hypothetical protein JMDDDDMK_00161 [Acidobacteria bacterium]|nr:hypothetical protein [Acidobacteriota bacterium]